MESKHTPGPWRNNGRKRLGDYVIAAGDTVVACAHVANVASFPDARLIAAAPDLLAALEETRDFIMGGDSMESLSPWARELIQDTIDPAIAKARGE